MGKSKKKRKYIYLDIEGVLTGDIHPVRSTRHYDLEFIPQAVQYLRFLVKETNALIIISSSLRGTTLEDLLELKKTFDWYDLGQYIIDQTPIFHCNRDDEILHHMKKNNISMNDMIVIDDDITDLTKLLNRLVHVNREIGFNHRNYVQAKKLLTRKTDKLIY